MWAVTHYRHTLYGKPFTLVTTHQPVEWLLTSNKLTGKHGRWALILQEYDFNIVHKPGLITLMRMCVHVTLCQPLSITGLVGPTTHVRATEQMPSWHGQQRCGRGIQPQ